MDGGRLVGSAVACWALLSGLVIGARALYEKITALAVEANPKVTDGTEIGDEEG
jgi:hypothetical protein